MDDNEKLELASLETLNQLLLLKRDKMNYVSNHNWDEATFARDTERNILKSIGIGSISIDLLQRHIRNRKLKDII